MQLKKGLLASVLFILVLSTALAGCGTNSSSDGDVLVFGRGNDSISLDAAVVTDGESIKVTKNIYDTLVDYGDDNTDIEAALATKWTVSNDGLTYTFTLREGVKFHDGTDFNAEAVVYNFERWMSGEGEYYYYKSMFGGFKGDAGHVIKDVKATDKLTVEFTLTRPQAPFLKNLAMPVFGIASPTAIKKHGDKYGENPVGTGPFVFEEWKRKDTITLVKNEDYWMEGYPKLSKIIFQSIPDNQARLNALMKGSIDIMDGVTPSDVASIDGEEGYKTYFRPSMNVGYLGLNVERGPLKNKYVRQALNHAVDKEAIIKAFYEGQAKAAKNPMPPVIGGYNDDIDAYPYDLKKAKQLLAKGGYPNGFTMELWAMPVPRPYMPDGKKVAEAIQASFAKIGVNARIKSYDWATYLDKARQGEADSFLLGWTGDNGDADNFLYVLLDKDTIDSNNYARYSNNKVHSLLIKAQSNPNEKEREALYKQAQEIIHDDAPWIPLVHSTPAIGASDKVAGYTPHPTGSDKLTKVYFK
jgi:peptide/nickel transport system substrate-binding protein